jgi:hypothetical protein
MSQEVISRNQIDNRLRRQVYQHFIDTGRAPTMLDLATKLDIAAEDIKRSCQRLSEQQSLLVKPGGCDIWMAMPFSGAPTPHRVRIGDREWYAVSAWDALGIPVMMKSDALIQTACGDCGRSLEIEISRNKIAEASHLFHFAVPVRDWWDNILYTSSTMSLFDSDAHIANWCTKHGVEKGVVMTLKDGWKFARAWFEDRLDPDWRWKSSGEIREMFASLGLTDEFWRMS